MFALWDISGMPLYDIAYKYLRARFSYGIRQILVRFFLPIALGGRMIYVIVFHFRQIGVWFGILLPWSIFLIYMHIVYLLQGG